MEQKSTKTSHNSLVILAVLGCLLLTGGIVSVITDKFRADGLETSSIERQEQQQLQNTIESPDEQPTNTVDLKKQPTSSKDSSEKNDGMQVQGLNDKNSSTANEDAKPTPKSQKSDWRSIFKNFVSRMNGQENSTKKATP